jgi:HAD superfamily hydrolase (TIGR01509 family)
MIEFLCRLAPQPLDAETVWAYYPRKKELFRERTARESPIPEPTRSLVKELAREGYRLAVVSSSGKSEIEPMLELSGLRAHLAAVVCGDDVRRHKPDPEPYLEAARLLGVQRALVVEDSDAGCESGRRAGFEVLRVSSAAETAERVRERLAK